MSFEKKMQDAEKAVKKGKKVNVAGALKNVTDYDDLEKGRKILKGIIKRITDDFERDKYILDGDSGSKSTLENLKELDKKAKLKGYYMKP